MAHRNKASLELGAFEASSLVLVKVVEASAQVVQLHLAKTLRVTSEYLVLNLIARVL